MQDQKLFLRNTIEFLKMSLMSSELKTDQYNWQIHEIIRLYLVDQIFRRRTQLGTTRVEYSVRITIYK